MKIGSGEFGLFVFAGGWKCRPIRQTCFKVGDEVKTHHFGGSTRAGVGKDSTCSKRGQYLEIWCTSGSGNSTDSGEDSIGRILWYKVDFVNQYGSTLCKDVTLTEEETEVAKKWMKDKCKTSSKNIFYYNR
jgi:hypothetical protein